MSLTITNTDEKSILVISFNDLVMTCLFFTFCAINMHLQKFLSSGTVLYSSSMTSHLIINDVKSIICFRT